ncbi:MAG: flagellar biosynthetic protein FliO [Spirochaetia bacterium]|nr:flagellar biosynthetic protein FliO [Spirochaetia bacterium]
MKNFLFLIFLSLNIFMSGQMVEVYAYDSGVAAEESLPIGDGTGNSAVAGNGFTFFDFFRMVLVLGFVLALIYGIFYLLRKINRQNINRDDDLVRILSYKSISPGKAVVAVKVGSHVYLLGTSEHSVSLISEIMDDETREMLEVESSCADGSADQSFRSYLMSAIRSKGKKK